MARNLNDMLASRSQDSQHRIAEMADEMLLEVKFQAIREELELTQAELARNMGISQPSVVAIEQRGNDVKLSTIKRYIEAMGGKMSINIELPTGKHVGFNV
ncbi:MULTISPECIES: helix-turn-helix domain-containing protein [Photobacterium]|jgi:DNA-binding XRE family transcriptional regulator|uniref:XRE family transcriptional regulator n=1 Tax=Photobacterium iliopiscarium TaxID=56192 RepID=A0A0D8P243_9GAMM|nr:MULTISPECIES: helix-turn-helix transcriptional regulator [Photobacterium]KJF84517.1 Cro/Cl family transcriptional regulator [Photobacterium phosphoreum]KJG11962.1 Cro/Cl family transcriptional regulator [Photobacterium iliopiscarium]KJG15281.1 Cro/Cl family transcriptional regulator [Photobacterium iliopiscarium]MCD9465500.1 XRE family transcriptional regulator [Photobacterium phosphoreum]MCD9472868.1 XRE family transcriptional regulator [Photobacterium phosphoreum]